MSVLSETLGRKFIITSEVKPPRGPDTSKLRQELDVIKDLKAITAVNVIDSPSARLFLSSLGASIMLQQYGIESIFQMVCRDRNMLALESDLLSAAAFGIENILALTGDHPQRGASDHPSAKPVYDLDSTSLIKTIDMMNQGKDPWGVELNAKTNFYVGGAISPTVNPIEPEVLKVKRKINAGVQFFQTQVIFDASVLEDFIVKADNLVGDIRPKVIASIIPIASQKMIAFLNKLPGINVPDSIAQRVINSKNPIEEGITVSLELIDKIKAQGLAGVHIMPVGRTNTLKIIVEQI